MAKLVILNQGMTGRTFDLNVERNTVGRVEDNTFQIADASVSSHHAEILLRGSDIVIKDLNSTNGTFLNNEKVSVSVSGHGYTNDDGSCTFSASYSVSGTADVKPEQEIEAAPA